MTLATVRPLLAELGELKRIRVAGRRGSLAEQGFRRGWSRLVAGEPAGRVALTEAAVAVAAARLAAIDATMLVGVGLDPPPVLRRAYDEVAHLVPEPMRAGLRAALDDPPMGHHDEPPPFVHQLVDQPRAGLARGERHRLLPPESHGDHCFTVAVYGTLLAPGVGADPGEGYLLGLAHHLHNAVLPDAGLPAESVLGDALPGIVDRLTEEVLEEVPHKLADRLRPLLAVRRDAGTAVGRAFHAANVLDRGLQLHQHARAAAFTVDAARAEVRLLPAGPPAAYQLRVLTDAGL